MSQNLPGRLQRESLTIKLMIGIYCQGNHKNPLLTPLITPAGARSVKGGMGVSSPDEESLCPTCGDLLRYSLKRIEKCPFRADKPTCGRCPVHCYKSEKRAQVRQVMRYAGPRMLLYHPLLTVFHYLDEATRGKRYNAN